MIECDGIVVAACMFISINLCVDLAYTLFIQFIYPFHRQSIIYQPNSIDVVIIMAHTLGK